jgi:DNA-directed RNA polymerase specialized sigma24 family protein
MASVRTRTSAAPPNLWTRSRSRNPADIEAIVALLDRLEPEEAQIMVLHHVSELSLPDIAQFLKQDVDDLHDRLTRAEHHATEVLKADPDLAARLGVDQTKIRRRPRSS